MGQKTTTNPEDEISLHINNKEMQLYVDSRCKKTINLKPNAWIMKASDKASKAKPDSDLMVRKDTLPLLVKSQSPYDLVMEHSIQPPLCRRDTK